MPSGGQLERLVGLARAHLGMDAALISRFTDGRQIVRAAAGDATSFGVSAGGGPLLDKTLCARMARGEIPNVIPDTALEPRARDLLGAVEPASRRIGAYVGVPLLLPDGELYGSLCCLSEIADPELNLRDVSVLRMLAELLTDDIVTERRRDDLQRLLGSAIDNREVRMALQPVIDLVTCRCTAMESLARFAPHLGSPEHVFAMAEQVDLRVELELLCLSQALPMLERLDAEQSLAVNMSPDVALAFATAPPPGVPLDRLVIEITEHAAVETYDALRNAITPLRQQGLRLAVDDAGAGFASLRHVVELRPDVLKIDRSLVHGIDSDLSRRSAITTFVLLALDIGATVVAEGVETEEELRTLMALGVDAAQGFLIARPSSHRDEIAGWARSEQLLPSLRAGSLQRA